MTKASATQNVEELCKALRDWDEYDEGKLNDARDEAADRIELLATTNEQLVATNEALIAENKRLGQQCEGLMQAGMNNGQALIIAENKLAKAVKLIDLAVELARWDLNPKLRDDMIDFTTELKG